MRLSVMCIHMFSVFMYMSVDSYIGQWLIFMLLHIIPYLLIEKRMCNIVIAKSYMYVGWVELAVYSLNAHTLMGEFLIHRGHRCVVIFVVSECRFL